MTELFGERSQELLAFWRDVRRKRKISVKREQAVLLALESSGFQLPGELRKWGEWEAFLYSYRTKPDDSSPPKLGTFASHVVEIELALVEPTKALCEGNFRKCADLVAAAPVLSDYLWPEIIAKIRNAKSETEVFCARLFVSLEMQLSRIACSDAQLQANGLADTQMLLLLFPDFDASPVQHPNTLFFEWLAQYSGVGDRLAACILQISKPPKDSDIGSSQRQLRRWKSGRGFPSLDVLDALFRNLYGDRAGEKRNPQRKDWDLCCTMAMAAKRLNFLMPLLVRLNNIREPVFPFGHASVRGWWGSRYQHWYRHWLPLIQN